MYTFASDQLLFDTNLKKMIVIKLKRVKYDKYRKIN